MFLYNFFKSEVFTKKSKPSSSDFSDFFRKASSREKRRVFLDVARKASAEQREVIRHSELKKI